MTKKKSPLLVGDLPKAKTKTKKKTARKTSAAVHAETAYGFVSKNLEEKTKVKANLPGGHKKPELLDKLLSAARTSLHFVTTEAQKETKQFRRHAEGLKKTISQTLLTVTQQAKSTLKTIEEKHLASVPFYQEKIRPLWSGR